MPSGFSTPGFGSANVPVQSVFTRTGAVAAADGDYYGALATALTGATGVSRYVGATASGAPVAGTFAVGDFVVDRAGGVWICTAAGTPGTWGPGVAAGSITNTHIATGAAIQASKFTGTLALLSTTTLGADGTFDIQSISQAYTDLVIVFSLRGTAVATTDSLTLRFNNDSGGNYDRQMIRGNTTTVSGAGGVAQTAALLLSFCPAASATAGRFAQGTLEIPGYTSATWFKAFHVLAGPGNIAPDIELDSGVWRSTAAINRIQVAGSTTANLLAGSSIRIYGR